MLFSFLNDAGLPLRDGLDPALIQSGDKDGCISLLYQLLVFYDIQHNGHLARLKHPQTFEPAEEIIHGWLTKISLTFFKDVTSSHNIINASRLILPIDSRL